MSAATKRKHVVRELLDEYPEPEGDQLIVRITAPRGNNLHEAEWPTKCLSGNDGGDADGRGGGERHLVSMPNKFRKNVWIRKGDYVIVDPIDEGNKVKAESK